MKKDLDQIIADFQKIQPTELQILQWSLSMERARHRRRNWVQIIGASAIGLIVGVVLMKSYYTGEDHVALDKFSATYDQVTVNKM